MNDAQVLAAVDAVIEEGRAATVESVAESLGNADIAEVRAQLDDLVSAGVLSRSVGEAPTAPYQVPEYQRLDRTGD